MLSGFERVRVEGTFDVVVTSGPTPSAKAIGDGRALDTVNLRVEGRTLVVSRGVNGWGGYPGDPVAKPVIRIVAPVLRGALLNGNGRMTIEWMSGQRVDLSLTGAGSMTVASAEADRLEAQVIGTGVLTVAGKALTARFITSGAGSIAAEGLLARALTVNQQGSGDGSFAARDTAAIFADGQGIVRVAGSPACTVRGGANVTCGTGKVPPP